MQQLYARVFLQILDSSIAEDFFLRHVFEDLIKLASKNGVVDITREAMARRLNLPLEKLNEALKRLESPDPKSRDPENDGRRIELLDGHRDWGWQILNWSKYDALRTKADVALRVATHRQKKARLASKETGLVGSGVPGSTVIPDGLAVSTDFVQAWQRWLEHLKQKKKPATIHAQDLQLRKLSEMGPDKAITALNHSIERNWQGIFEPQQSGAKRQLSPGELTGIIRTKEERAATLKGKYCSDVATGPVWQNAEKQAEWVALRKEIKDLKIRLEAFA